MLQTLYINNANQDFKNWGLQVERGLYFLWCWGILKEHFFFCLQHHGSYKSFQDSSTGNFSTTNMLDLALKISIQSARQVHSVAAHRSQRKEGEVKEPNQGCQISWFFHFANSKFFVQVSQTNNEIYSVMEMRAEISAAMTEGDKIKE